MNGSHVAIVGGGWAGLAAAAELARGGMRVSLFEAAPELGGRARSVARDGRVVDNGQHILSGAYAQTLRLIRLVGVDPDRALARIPLTLVCPGRFSIRAPRLPAPLHLAAALLGASGFGWADRLAALRLMHRLRRMNYLPPPTQSVGELLRRCRQTDAARLQLWTPLCIAALNTPPELASARVFAAVLRDGVAASRAASDLLLPSVDLGGLFPHAAADFVRNRGGRVATGQATRAVRHEAAGFRLEPGGAEIYSHLILAVGPHQLSRLADSCAALGRPCAALDAFSYEPIVTCYLQYPAEVRLPEPMIVTTGPLCQWLFDRGRLGGEPGLLAAVTSAATGCLGIPRAALAARIHAEIEAVCGKLPPPQWQTVITEKRATFACTPGLIRPGMTTAAPRLYLAGDYVECDYPATLEAAVRSGVRCAEAILEDRA